MELPGYPGELYSLLPQIINKNNQKDKEKKA
jgi:hypothetical protein